jgi:hypothetical protein
MGKRIESPVKRYPGHVVIPDYYDFGQLMAWDDGVSRWPELSENPTFQQQLEVKQAQAASIIPMIEAWHIEGIPEKPTALPATPIRAAVQLLGWLTGEIGRAILEDETIDPTPGGASTNG